jgi:hypothetical protein
MQPETTDPANWPVILKGLRLSTGEGILIAPLVKKRKVDRGQLIAWPSTVTSGGECRNVPPLFM